MKDLISFNELYSDLDEDYIDPLTGLYSISGLRHILKRAVEKYNKDVILEVIFFNVSEFALYNQTYNLTGGDKLLCDIAESIRMVFKNSVCARFSGDHFIVVTSSSNMDRDIMKIHNDVKMYGGKSMEIKAGIYEMRLGDDIMDAIECAHLACLSIKNRFDKTYRYYDNTLRQALNNKRYVLDHVDQAIEDGWLKVYYQPIIRIRSGQVSDFEALVRWDDPTYGMMQPGKFIPVLENSNQIYKVDMFVIEQVAKDLKEWIKRGLEPVPVSINLSRQDFDRELCKIFEYIEEICEEYDVPKELFDIEITESVLGANEKFLRSELRKFNEAGFQLWMDDFGTGFSSFNTLKNYKFDVLKIDMKFLKEIEDEGASEKTKTILFSIIRMAKRLGMETVCEGTETEDRLRLLTDLGCEKAQGYYFSRPVPFEQVFELDLEYEAREIRDYEIQTGLINVMDSPLIGQQSKINHQPMAMIEVNRGYARVIQENSAFREFFYDRNESDSKYTFEKWVNSDSIFARHFLEAAERCRKLQENQEIDFVLDGKFGMISFDFIAEAHEGETFSLVLRVENLQGGRGMKTVSLKQAAIRNVFSLYMFAHVFDIENNKVLLLYNGNAEYRLGSDELEIESGVREFASKLIAPEDQARFIDFYNVKNLKSIYHSGEGIATSSFRTSKNGEMTWMLYTVMPFEYLDKWYIFSGCREIEELRLPKELDGAIKDSLNRPDSKNVKKIDRSKEIEEVSKRLLAGDKQLQRTLDLFDIGIFWKDRNRRFVGANKYFIDYYGFSSFAAIAGLNDEEVGWHVNPGAFKSDEEDVITTGISIRGKVGNCLRKGDNRTIIAFKKPLYVDKNIEGLVGCFFDVTDMIDILPRFKSQNRSSDEGDVHVLDVMEYGDTLSLYIREYERYNHDFALIMIEIDGYEKFIKNNGEEYYDGINKSIVSVLSQLAGVTSVVARPEGNTYAILHQFDDTEDVSELTKEIGANMAEIMPKGLAAVVNAIVYSGLSDEERQDLKWNFASDRFLD